MGKKIKFEILDKKVSNGIINLFGNTHNMVGIYDKDKVEKLKERIYELSVKYGEKIYFVFDLVNDKIDSIGEPFFDRLVDSIDNMNKKETPTVLVSEEVDEPRIEEDVKYMPNSFSIPMKRINFEDLEPLGQLIEQEEDIYELQELKMQLLFNEDYEKDVDGFGMRKK